MRTPRIDDRVLYQGKMGTVINNRFNGMYDVALDPPSGKVKVGYEYWFSGTVRCLYEDEFEVIEEVAYGQ